MDDDGYFAFLSRYFETIEDECGFVDLHGDNTYYKEELLKLQECLIDAEKELESRPDVWSEYIGTWLNEAGGEIYDKVEKVKLAELIGSLSRAANEAYTSDKELLFFGD